MAAPLRRVVTGHTANGRSTVIADGPLEDGPVPDDRYVWVTTGMPADNGGADRADVPHRLEPPGNGSLFRVVEFPPESALAGLSAADKEAIFRDMFAAMGATHCRVDTSRSPSMHRTATIDYAVVLRGEVTLLLDEGEAVLRPGDLVVQRGTNHGWVVRGNEPALVAFVMLPAKPV